MKTKNFWSTPTPFSRVLAAVLFVILPLLGFLLGVKYEDMVVSANDADMYYLLQKAMEPNGKPVVVAMQMKQYTIPTLGIMFSYPSGWKVTQENGATKMISASEVAKTNPVNMISLGKWAKGKTLLTPEDIKKELEKDKTAKVTTVEVAKVNGYATEKTDTKGIKTLDTYFFTPNKDVVVVSMVDTDGTMSPIYTKLLSSVQFAKALTGQ